MNIEFPSFAAFALQSSPGQERCTTEAHTLTLRLSRSDSFGPRMNGKARMQTLPMRSDTVLRAAVVPCDGPVLTITF